MNTQDILDKYNGKYKDSLNKWYQNKQLTKKKKYITTIGQYGHICSFVDIITTAIKIFEYDIYIHHRTIQLLSNFNDIKNSYDMIYFGCSSHSNEITGTFAIYMKQNVFQDILDLLQLYILPTDEILTILHNNYIYISFFQLLA